MPRLTNADYLLQRARLRDNWTVHRGSAFIELETIEEMELHAYFAPMRDLTDDQAIAFRKQATIERPYLPSRAGKSYARALPFLDNPSPTVPTDMPKHTGRHALRPPGSVVTVKSLARPEVDTKRLARLLIQLAKADLDNESAEWNDIT